MCPLWLDGITEPTGQHVGSFHSGGGSSTERALNGCQLQMLSHCTAQYGRAVDHDDMLEVRRPPKAQKEPGIELVHI